MDILLVSALFLILMVLGAPIGTALGVAGVATIYQFDLGIEMLGVNFSSGIASFPLLAIPFCISYLMMPILIPVLNAFQIDPVWYGVIFISALAVGQATPPVGVNLFTAANLIKGEVDAVAKEAIPYVIMDVAILILLSLLPILSLYLPVRAGLYTP